MSEPAKDWFPTMSGKCRAWQPEYFDEAKNEWRDVPYREVEGNTGNPSPLAHGHLFAAIGLCGYEQAMALAWQFAALHAQRTVIVPKVRVREYDFIYDIKASKRTTEAENG